MAKLINSQLHLFTLVMVLFVVGTLSLKADDDRKVYIVYMGSISEEYAVTSEHHINILQQVMEGRTAEKSLVRSYTRSFNGFAAILTEKESENLSSMKEVVSVFPSRTLKLQTTRSWDFMGLIEDSNVVLRNLTSESDVILGSIDTGVWPELPSFSDDGIGPPPKKWKGSCKGGKNFTCNNKVIGAHTTFDSARDTHGHGTHTASTAVGRHVDGASFFGLAEGIARGAAPSARLAVYKVCEGELCNEKDILTSFDEAIGDGVDLITVSIGGALFPIEFYSDSIAIGSFHALQKGILTVQSAGNNGNTSSSTISFAPWLFSVAASSSDRRIRDKVVLENGKSLDGYSINPFTSKEGMFPLVYGVAINESQCTENSAKLCLEGCFDKNFVKGKILVCDSTDGNGILEGYKASALGVLARVFYKYAEIHPLPAIELEPRDFDALISYINSTKNPKANILKCYSFNDTSAPYVIEFSARGPNAIASDILKPDITAPGVEILAVVSPVANLTVIGGDKITTNNYTIKSGTSMSCPHVTGASVYIKSLHPNWSPSAIKSALMTTACPMSPSKNKDAEFAYGSGHLDPVKAADPGLVYETVQDEYLTFFCRLGYAEEQIALITGNKSFICPKKRSSVANDVNYPSLSSLVDVVTPVNVRFSRTVTNVGIANSIYMVKVESPKAIKVKVNPTTLSFTSLNEKKSFEVSVVGKGLSSDTTISASLVWSDGQHNVRSPIVVYTKNDFL